MTVYVAQPTAGKNLTPALVYGDLVQVVDRAADPLLEVQSIYDQAERVLSKFKPAEDYLLMIGDPIVIGIVASRLASNGHSYRALKWDKQSRAYQTITVPCRKERG